VKAAGPRARLDQDAPDHLLGRDQIGCRWPGRLLISGYLIQIANSARPVDGHGAAFWCRKRARL
jgi:hypothetical protein